MKKNKKITGGIASEDKINKEFINVWKRAEQNKTKKTEERLYFLDIKTLLHVLSDKRLSLLNILHQSGNVSIKALSRITGRNYRNVYDDVKLLMNAGLIHKNESKEIFVPWDKIQAEIELAT